MIFSNRFPSLLASLSVLPLYLLSICLSLWKELPLPNLPALLPPRSTHSLFAHLLPQDTGCSLILLSEQWESRKVATSVLNTPVFTHPDQEIAHEQHTRNPPVPFSNNSCLQANHYVDFCHHRLISYFL